MGELNSWNEFLCTETTKFDDFNRRDLKADKSRFRSGLSKEIRKFSTQNFQGMTESKLEKLYLRVLERRGLEMPLKEFESEFATLKTKTLAGAPKHCTVVISLWGLQTKFPEDMLSKDIIEAVQQIRSSEKILQSFSEINHRTLADRRDDIGAAVRKNEFASRICVLACFNLVEASLNALAWNFASGVDKFDNLSERQKKLIRDGNFRDKLIKYPEILSGRFLWNSDDSRVSGFLNDIKPYRDSLVHASPFSTPEKYGGIDKLKLLYRIDGWKAQQAVSQTVLLLIDLFRHISGDDETLPPWLLDFASKTQPDAQSLQPKR